MDVVNVSWTVTLRGSRVRAVRCCIGWFADIPCADSLRIGSGSRTQNAWLVMTGAWHSEQVSVGIVAVTGAVVSG